MALNLNLVQFAGNVTRDPQIRLLSNENAVAQFGLAVNRRFRGGDGEMKEEATFFEIECWGRTAQFVGEYLAKGSAVYVQGRAKMDQWQDKDGNRRSRLVVVAELVQFTGNKVIKGATAPAQAKGAAAVAAFEGAVGDGAAAVPHESNEGVVITGADDSTGDRLPEMSRDLANDEPPF